MRGQIISMNIGFRADRVGPKCIDWVCTDPPRPTSSRDTTPFGEFATAKPSAPTVLSYKSSRGVAKMSIIKMLTPLLGVSLNRTTELASARHLHLQDSLLVRQLTQKYGFRYFHRFFSRSNLCFMYCGNTDHHTCHGLPLHRYQAGREKN